MRIFFNQDTNMQIISFKMQTFIRNKTNNNEKSCLFKE